MEPTTSPYEPPKSALEDPAPRPLEVVPVGHGLRFANLVVDYLVYMALSALLGVVVAAVWGEDGVRVLISLPRYAIGAAVLLTYYIGLEGLTGRTVGKWVTGTRVVNVEGTRASFGRILGRSLARLIPFEAFSFLGRRARGWHDSLPGTYVVKCR